MGHMGEYNLVIHDKQLHDEAIKDGFTVKSGYRWLQGEVDDADKQFWTRLCCSREKCVQIGMVSWGLRNRRNKWVWDRTNGSVFGVMASTNHLLKEWREAQIRDVGGRQQGGARKWEKTAEGWFKINVNAAVFQDSIGCGAVIRDAQVEFIGAMCKKVEGAWTPREVEAITLKEALSWIIEMEYEKCVFETDSKALA
ncbi:uncharacterized protein LOC141691547 [Apium graveolens]|uniref:uncharacterized protein LOC141691547 n=1 Tax=Apium graveolens TaxID=4045 RepID=UPI003D7A1D26